MIAADILFHHYSAAYRLQHQDKKYEGMTMPERDVLGRGQRIQLLSPAKSSSAASSQSCGASMFTLREQSRHQAPSQPCMQMRILDRL
jgi:hypothetical protein